MQHFSDRLAAAIRARRSVVCVGLDPALEGMPPALVETAADALTASPYLGADSLEPLVAHCADRKGVFVLTRRSNAGAALLQERELEGYPLVVRVAELVAELGAGHIGVAAGFVVNASRSIIYAWQTETADYRRAAAAAAESMRDDLAFAL